MTPLQTFLDSVRGRLEASTPGPWHQKHNADRVADTLVCSDKKNSPTGSSFIIAQAFGHSVGQAETDAALIADAPTDLATLLKVVEVQREALMETLRLAGACTSPIECQDKLIWRCVRCQTQGALAECDRLVI